MGTHALVLRRSMLQTIIDNGKMAIETSTQRYGIPPHQRATHRAVSDDSPVNMPLPIDEIWLYDRSLRSLVSHAMPRDHRQPEGSSNRMCVACATPGHVQSNHTTINR